jgi:hypothetical protein
VIRSALADYDHRHGHPKPRGTTLVTRSTRRCTPSAPASATHGANGRPPQPEPLGDPDHDLVTAAQRATAQDDDASAADPVIPLPRTTLVRSEGAQDAPAEPTVVAGRGGDWSDYV